MKITVVLFQLVFFILAAPFLSGLITKIKNNLRMRKGQSVLQPYYNIFKLFSKGEVISETASWIFRAAPFVVLASTLCAAALVPVFIIENAAVYLGDFLVLIFIFSVGRFFLSLAALDTASAFGGMGSSREMFISSFVEPVVCLAAFSLSLQFGSTSVAAWGGIHPLYVSSCVAAAALFLVALAETSRIPIDNQETHLELTMVHEAMVLEYSGKSLAAIEMASSIKQMIWFFLIAQIIFPIFPPAGGSLWEWISWGLWYCARIVMIAIAVAVTEVSVAKMRLFRVIDFLEFALVLAVIATISAILGV